MLTDRKILRRFAIALAALVAIAVVGSLAGNHAKSAQPDGIIMFQCTNQNDIMVAAGAAERGHTDTLEKLHKSSSCVAAQPKPVTEAFFDHERSTVHVVTENKGGATIAVVEVEFEMGSTWLLVMVRPGLLPKA